MLLPFLGSAQYERKLVKEIPIPLSEPNERGKLEIRLISGSVKVQAYEGKVALIKAYNYEKNDAPEKKGGMTRIPNNSFGLEITEEDNEIEVNAETWRKKMDFEVMIPKNFDLNLGTVNGGDIWVEGVSGALEISNVNGDITLKDVSGWATTSTVNGEVIVNFVKTTPEMPMAFSSLNGKIDVTFPKQMKATCKIKSDRGEIYSDFEMKVQKKEVKTDKSSGNYQKISFDQWIYGQINGGGTEMMFKNMNGDIFIRKG